MVSKLFQFSSLNFSKIFFILSFISIIYITLLIIPDLLTLWGALYIFNVTKQYYYNVLAGGIVCNFFVNFLMVFLVFMMRKVLRRIINVNISENNKLICISALILIVLTIFFYN